MPDNRLTSASATHALSLDGCTGIYQKVILSDILSYLRFYRNSANVDALRRVVLSNYSADDITEAKKLHGA